MKKITYIICAALMCMHSLLNAMDTIEDDNLQEVNLSDALYLAVRHNNLSEVQRLINAKADVNAKSCFGSPLVLAAANGYVEVVRELLAANAHLETRDTYGETALSAAAICGWTETVKVLLNANADPNIINYHQKIALISVACNRHIDVVRLLIAAGGYAPLSCFHDLIALAEQGNIVVSIIMEKITPLLMEQPAKFENFENLIEQICYRKIRTGPLRIDNTFLNFLIIIANKYAIYSRAIRQLLFEKRPDDGSCYFSQPQIDILWHKIVDGAADYAILQALIATESIPLAKALNEPKARELMSNNNLLSMIRTLFRLRSVEEPSNVLYNFPPELIEYLIQSVLYLLSVN